MRAFQQRLLAKLQHRLVFWLVFASLAPSTHSLAEESYRLAEFRVIDRQYLEIAREKINDRARLGTGSAFKGNKAQDLPLLQRLLDEKLVKEDETEHLQAMGVILGDTLRSEYPLDWVRYIDRQGASRALQLRHNQHFVFPITAISRRASVGAEVNVEAIYRKMREPIALAYER